MAPRRELDLRHLRQAARIGLRGHGGAEPNPLVGCVIVAPQGEVVGWGFHRRCGEAHAEVAALRRAGDRAEGATAYVTLEPCAHTGRTGPCTQALLQARIARVVIARRDPNPAAAGGLESLRVSGVRVDLVEECAGAVALSDPFIHRLQTGLPWVIAKWAQTVDGRLTTRAGQSRWISGELSRRMVHRERGRVDAILTGVGTVLADDPMLTARGVRRRRVACRVIIDPELRTPLDAKVVTTTSEAPTLIICTERWMSAGREKAEALSAAGVEVLPMPADGKEIALGESMLALRARHETATMLVEAGAGLLRRLFQQRLVNEAWVFTGPLLLGDEQALPCLRGMIAPRLEDGITMNLTSLHRRGSDIVARYRVVGSRP